MIALSPPVTVLVKLGSIARHVEEFRETGEPVDLEAAAALLTDPEVREWMREADKLVLLPVKR